MKAPRPIEAAERRADAEPQATSLPGRAAAGPARSSGTRKKNRATLAGLLGASMVLLSACGSSSSSGASGKAASNASVVIGYENNGADPSMITVKNKYFQKELGSNVSLHLFSSGPAALAAIASGSLQFMCGIGLPPVISAIARGVPLTVVWNQERYMKDAGIVVKTTSGITSLSGLKGKTIAIVTGSESSFELPALLAQKGVPLSSVHQLNMSPAEMESAWTTNQIQAAIVWNPAFNDLTSHGGTVLATDASLPPSATSYNVCVANKTFVQSNPAAAVGFVKAMQSGVSYMNAHPAQALTIMASTAGISAATAKTELAGYQIYDLADQVTPAVLGQSSGAATAGTATALLNNWKSLYKQGFITTAPPSNLAPYVDSTPAQSAIG